MYTLTVALSVRFGPVDLFASVPETGYSDPSRFPERLLISGLSGSASSQVVSVPSGGAALVLRPSFSVWPVAYLLTVASGDDGLLSLEVSSYNRAGSHGVAEAVRHRLHSVSPIPRLAAYRLRPDRFAPSEPTIAFTPALPPGAVVQ